MHHEICIDSAFIWCRTVDVNIFSYTSRLREDRFRQNENNLHLERIAGSSKEGEWYVFHGELWCTVPFLLV